MTGVQTCALPIFQDIILKGDSMVVYKALCEKSPPLSSVEAMVMGMQEMAKEFRQIKFSHVRRQGNRPAHLLVKYASSIRVILLGVKRIITLLSKL